jgi:hypothetical protein
VVALRIIAKRTYIRCYAKKKEDCMYKKPEELKALILKGAKR